MAGVGAGAGMVPELEEDNRDNEFIAELVRLLESHGNDEFKRKHAEIPSLLQQLDVLTQRRKRQEENLKIYKERVSRLQGLAQCHKDMLDLSKKLVKWLGNGFSSAEILENIRDVDQKADLIERIRANAIRGGRERQVRDALERLENLRHRVIDGLAELGEGDATQADELENSIQVLMKREKSEVEKTKTSCNRLQQEVQKIDDELSHAEKELQRAISCAYQSAIKQSSHEQSFLHGEPAGPCTPSPDQAHSLNLSDEDCRRYESALRDHVRAMQLDLVDDCSDADDSNYSDDDQTTSISDDAGVATLERPQMCMKPRIVSAERDNGKLKLEVDLQSSLSESRPESVSFIVETILENYHKSSVVKNNRWNTAVPLPNEDSSLTLRVRAQNAVGLGNFSEPTLLQVEGVRSRKRRLASEKAETDKLARSEEVTMVITLQARTGDLKEALSASSSEKVAAGSDEVQRCIASLARLHTEKKIRASSDAAAALRAARAAVKESVRLEETRKKAAAFLIKVEEVASSTHFEDPTRRAFDSPSRSASDAERLMSEAEVSATAVCLEWQELINEADEKGTSVENLEQVRVHFFKEIAREVEKCNTPPRALGDVLDLAAQRNNVFGTRSEELQILKATFKKKRESWLKRREELLLERRNGTKSKSSKKTKKVTDKKSETARTVPIPPLAASVRANAVEKGTTAKKKKEVITQTRRHKVGSRRPEAVDAGRPSPEHARRPGKNGTYAVEPSREQQKRSIASLIVGRAYTGRVVGIARFGFFVDIGCEKPGLVHISQIREGFISNVHDEVKMNAEVTVRIASLSVEKQNFSCTMRENVDFSSSSEIFDGPQFDEMEQEEPSAGPASPGLQCAEDWPNLVRSEPNASYQPPAIASSVPQRVYTSPQSAAVQNSESLGISQIATVDYSANVRGYEDDGRANYVADHQQATNGYSPFGGGASGPVAPDFYMRDMGRLQTGVPVPHQQQSYVHQGLNGQMAPPAPLTNADGAMAQGGPSNTAHPIGAPGYGNPGFGPFGGGKYSMFGGMSVGPPLGSGNTPGETPAALVEPPGQEEVEDLNSDIVNSLML